MAFFPQVLGGLHWLDPQICPPGHFVAGLMQLPMMTAAERYSEFVADFKTKRSGLSKPQVMRIGRRPPTDETWLRSNKS
jgi:hypothetical protein